MKNLLIIVLVLGLAAAMFLTRPQKADFEQYARANKLTDEKSTGGPTVIDTISQQLRTFAGPAGIQIQSPTDAFLSKCTYDNYLLWTNVSKDGQVIYTGMVGHWFHRNPPAPSASSAGAPAPAGKS